MSPQLKYDSRNGFFRPPLACVLLTFMAVLQTTCPCTLIIRKSLKGCPLSQAGIWFCIDDYTSGEMLVQGKLEKKRKEGLMTVQKGMYVGVQGCSYVPKMRKQTGVDLS